MSFREQNSESRVGAEGFGGRSGVGETVEDDGGSENTSDAERC